MKALVRLAACLCGLLCFAAPLHAQAPLFPKDSGPSTASLSAVGAFSAQEPVKPQKARSPWLFSPLMSANPKLATAVGGMGAYLHYFDQKSQVSMFGGGYEYSTSHSSVGALFARMSASEDHHRIFALAGFGYINNEYEDYLGSGQPLRTTDDVKGLVGVYVYRFWRDWFAGGLGVFGKYTVAGATSMDQNALDALGVTGLNAGALGVILMHDSRDYQDMPSKGWWMEASNQANRESLGSDAPYDVYRLDARVFIGHGKGHVFAARQNNQFTSSAPASGETTVQLRGYKQGEYLARSMSSIEGEERISFSRRWGATVFGGVARLYGGSASLVDSNGWYPSYGAGLHFVVKPEDHMLINFEYARGNSGNYGVYLRFGYAW